MDPGRFENGSHVPPYPVVEKGEDFHPGVEDITFSNARMKVQLWRPESGQDCTIEKIAEVGTNRGCSRRKEGVPVPLYGDSHSTGIT